MASPAGRKSLSSPSSSPSSSPLSSQQTKNADAMKEKRLALAAKAASSSEMPQTSSGATNDTKPKASGWRKVLGMKPILTRREKSIEIVLTLAEIAMNAPDFMKTEGIFRIPPAGSEKAKALKNPEKYFKECKDSGDRRRYNAIATVFKETLRTALGNEEKITLALIAGAEPEELKAFIHPDLRNVVDVRCRMILSNTFSVDVPPLFSTLAKLCHAVAEHEDVNKMGLSQLMTCIVPNLMPPMNESPGDMEEGFRRMAFAGKLNGLAAGLMELWMTGKEPEIEAPEPNAEVSRAEANSSVRINQTSRRLHRSFSMAMKHKQHEEEPEVQYAEGLRWQSVAAVSTSSIYSTFGGGEIDSTDVPYDIDYCDVNGSSSEDDAYMSLEEQRDLQRAEQALMESAGNAARKRRQHSGSSSDSGNSSASPTSAETTSPVARNVKSRKEEIASPPVPRHSKATPPVAPPRGLSLQPRPRTRQESSSNQNVQKKR